MYLADWDAGWPNEHERWAIDFFNTAPGGGNPRTWPDICNHTHHANPYIRSAVVLEDYVKSIDVWKCPSARCMNGAGFIVPMGTNGDWVQTYKDYPGVWGQNGSYNYGPCYPAFPPGWGGDVTDSFLQDRMASLEGYAASGVVGAGTGVFVQGVITRDDIYNLNLSTVQDAGRYIACGDGGKQVEMWSADGLAFPDTCMVNYCGGTSCPAACCWGDWTNCSWSRTCGLDANDWMKFMHDGTFRKQFTRHMGGSNVGFLDGHAKWYLSEAIMTQSPPFEDAYFDGPCSCWPGNGVWD
jgi:prepilin-type processing-associated H-X9-DG protein